MVRTHLERSSQHFEKSIMDRKALTANMRNLMKSLSDPQAPPKSQP